MKKDVKHTEKDVFTAIMTTEVPDFVTEEKEDRVKKQKEYLPFGTDNLYPQALSALYRKSVVLRAVINSIATFCTGRRFDIDSNNVKAIEFIYSPNNTSESLKKLYKKHLIDKLFSGNAYIELVTDAKKSYLNIFHIQSVKCRHNNKGERVLIHPNWEKYKKNDKQIKDIPLYPKFEKIDGAMRSIVHVKNYEPNFDNYGIPRYIAALDSAAIGYKTNKWNVSRLDNSFQSSGVLVIDGNMTDDDANKLKDEFKKEMLGEGNQGKVLMIIKKLGGEGTEYTPINSNSEGDWIELHNQSTDDLITANGWKKSLSGITEQSGFDVDRILNDYQVLKSTYINDEQEDFIDLITKITFDFGIDLEGLSIINIPPVSLLTKLSSDRFVKIWEARKESGLEYDSEDEKQNVFIDESKEKKETPIATAISKIKAYLKNDKAN